MKKMMREKRKMKYQILKATQLVKVRERTIKELARMLLQLDKQKLVKKSSEYLDEKYDSVGEFDAPTCSGDRFYDIFDKEEEIFTEVSIVWVNTNKTIWEGRSKA